MTTYFLDTSAVVKRYLVEIGSPWVIHLTNSAVGNTIIIGEITRVEAAAAIAARQRASGGISLQSRDRSVDFLLWHCDHEYRNVVLTPATLSKAVALTQRRRLRGYDAVQLAMALLTNEQLVSAGLAALIFITADADLIAAAQAEGLLAENPNQHP